jgi:hypothetical protein
MKGKGWSNKKNHQRKSNKNEKPSSTFSKERNGSGCTDGDFSAGGNNADLKT